VEVVEELVVEVVVESFEVDEVPVDDYDVPLLLLFVVVVVVLEFEIPVVPDVVCVLEPFEDEEALPESVEG